MEMLLNSYGEDLYLKKFLFITVEDDFPNFHTEMCKTK